MNTPVDTTAGENQTPEENVPQDGNWYTIEDLMKKFNRSKSTINRWRREKGLVCCEVFSTVLVHQFDLDKFLWRHRNNRLLVIAFILWQGFAPDILPLCDV